MLLEQRIEEIECSMIGEKRANCVSREQEIRIIKGKLVYTEKLESMLNYRLSMRKLGHPFTFPWNKMLIHLYH